MRIIGIIASKGGAGKSTLAAHLAVLAERDIGPALLVDADPQGSLSLWYSLRGEETPVVASATDRRELDKLLQRAREYGAGVVIIDAPPHASAFQSELIRACDLALIPARPSLYDLAAVPPTVETATILRKPYLVVLNACPARRPMESEAVTQARQRLVEAGVPNVWPEQITDRVAFRHALNAGLTVAELDPGGKADREIARLWKTVRGILA